MEYLRRYTRHRHRWTLAGCMLISLFLFFTCREEERAEQPPQQVLLVYLAGDNNLSGESYQKLETICSGWDGDPRGCILIWHDPRDAAPVLYTLAQEEGVNRLQILEEYAEESSADPAVLSRVVGRMREWYPRASSYGMLLFSHASGWLPEGALSQPTRSVLTDGREEMELTDLAAALPDSLFDFMVFEACYMAGIEVAYELRHKTRYLLASSAEIVSPGFTHVYDDAVNLLLQADLNGFARRAFGYFESGTGYINSATLSLIDTSGLDALADFIGRYADRQKEVDLATLQHFDRTSYRLFFDFEDYYSRLVPVGEPQEELHRLVADCVPLRLATPYFMLHYNGFAIEKHSGMTTYVCQNAFPELNEAYRHLQWGQW